MDRVLIVEDDQITRAMIRNILTKRGYQVNEADNGNSGYEEAATGKPDLILLDIIMPHMNGLELLSQLKVNEDTRSIPVVMLTGRENMEDMALAFNEGAAGYILKPVTADDLEDTITRVMPKNHAVEL